VFKAMLRESIKFNESLNLGVYESLDKKFEFGILRLGTYMVILLCRHNAVKK
jgi:hypothetical protein